jgi:hypothetical protein
MIKKGFDDGGKFDPGSIGQRQAFMSHVLLKYAVEQAGAGEGGGRAVAATSKHPA